MNNSLHHAAVALRILGQVERAHAIGDLREVERLLAGVDPIDLHDLISVVQILALSLPDPKPTAVSLRAVPCQ